MNLLHQAAPLWLVLAGWGGWLPIVWLAWRRARQGFVPRGIAEHAWLGGAVVISLLWLCAIHVANGPAFGMLGSALYAVVFGRERAILGLALASVLHCACTHGAWANLGLDGLLLAALPATVAGALQPLIARRLPRNLFVFLIGNGMFSCLLATAAAQTALLAVSYLVAPAGARSGFGQSIGPMLLLSWSEAIVSGMLFSALVIFEPEVVLTYDPERYLTRG